MFYKNQIRSRLLEDRRKILEKMEHILFRNKFFSQFGNYTIPESLDGIKINTNNESTKAMSRLNTNIKRIVNIMKNEQKDIEQTILKYQNKINFRLKE